MMRLRFGAILGAVFSAVLVPAAMAQVPDAAPSTPVDEVVLPAFEPTREEAVLEGFVDGVVEAHRRDHKTPAVSVSVVRKGQIVFAKAYGFADEETRDRATGTDTLFRIGSVSKTFIWTSVMMLQERGLIDLDADVNTYLKGVTIPDAFDAPVTMNDLMAHRAGFEDTFGVFTLSDETDMTLTEALNAHMPKRVHAPGTRSSYSNWGAALAAKIVEDIAGVSYETFLQDEILTPLSMTHTTLKGPKIMSEAQRAALAKGYSSRAGVYVNDEPLQIGPYAPAGAMSSSAGDMARWMLAHLGAGTHDGVQLMSPQTHALMLTRAFDDRPGGADMAHGFMSIPYHGVSTFGHGGATSSYLAYMVLVPELDLGIYVAQNSAGDNGLVGDLPRLVIDHVLGTSAEPARDDPAFEEKAASFAGNYLANRRSFSGFEKLFALSSVIKVAPAKGGALTVAGGGKVFHYAPLPGAADTFEDSSGRRIVFGRGAQGHVTHFSDGSGVHSFEKVGAMGSPETLKLAIGFALLFAVTTLLGAWRRVGRKAANATGIWLGRAGFAAAVIVVIFIVMLFLVLVELSNASATSMLTYPPASVAGLRMVGYGVLAAGLAGIVSLWTAWRTSGWGIWRKLHHSLFALSLAALTVMLVIWKVVFSATV